MYTSIMLYVIGFGLNLGALRNHFVGTSFVEVRTCLLSKLEGQNIVLSKLIKLWINFS